MAIDSNKHISASPELRVKKKKMHISKTSNIILFIYKILGTT